MSTARIFNKKITLFKLSSICCTTFILLILNACGDLAITPDKTAEPIVKHVVLISIDGLRPDAISPKNSKYLHRLSHAGLYYPNAQTIKRSVTLPSHTSMLTGLDISQHKVSKNHSLPGYISHPTVMQILKNHQRSTAAFFSKKKLNYLFTPDSLDFRFGRGRDGVDYHQTSAANIAREFEQVWPKFAYNLTFIHIREPDSSGHAHGWMSEDYLTRALPAADEAVGRIYNSIQQSPYAKDTLLIITSDHGGKDTSHWHNRPEDLGIPWIAIHPTIKPAINKNSIVIYDTMPTILYLMQAPAPQDLSGKVIPAIKTIFESTAP